MKTQQEIEKLAEQYIWGKIFLTKNDKYQTEIAYMSGYKQCQEDIGFGNKRIYSEEDMQEYAEFCIRCNQKGLPCIIAKDWFEQFKKK